MWVKPWLEMEIPFGMSKDTLAISGRISGGLWGVTQILLDYIAHVNFYAASNSFSIPRCQKSRRWKVFCVHVSTKAVKKNVHVRKKLGRRREGNSRGNLSERRGWCASFAAKSKTTESQSETDIFSTPSLAHWNRFLFFCMAFCSWLEIEFCFLININMRTYRGPIDRQKLI